MPFTFRAVTAADEPFLWEMLFYAAAMAESGATAPADALDDPFLRPYVQGWGRAGDLGVLALEAGSAQPVGAAWVRLLAHADEPGVPELAMALLPSYTNQGLGGQLLTRLLDQAQGHYPAVALTVRAHNPARRLYERHGFVVVGTLTNRVGGKSFAMTVQLRGPGGTAAATQI